nr:DUF4136 domain-containing protein [uncultured Carboxylicivirga sp.]
MKQRNLIFFCLLLSILLSCSNYKVISNYDESIDFSKYKHYLIMERLESENINNDAKKYIGKLIKDELTSRNLSENLSPDLIVKLMIISEEKEATAITRTNNFYWGSDQYQYGWGIGTGVNNISYNNYLEGTLIIDIIDKEKKLLVWEGIANGVFKNDAQKNEAKIRKVIAELFSAYPVKKQ